jgi:hypothetical protein
LLDTRLWYYHAVITGPAPVKRGFPLIQLPSQLGHGGNQLPNEAISAWNIAQEAHRVLDLLKAVQDANEIHDFALLGVNPGYQPFKVGQLSQGCCELIHYGRFREQRIHSVKAGIDPRAVRQRMANPLAQQSLAEGRNASVEQREQSAFNASVNTIGEDFEVDQALPVQNQTGCFADGIVPRYVAEREQISIDLKDLEVLNQGSK